MTTRRMVMDWRLRQVMADRGIYQTSDMVPLLADRGVNLSREHVYRLVTGTPQRLNLEVLAALCDILGCDPSDLLVPTAVQEQPARTAGGETGPGIGNLRPIRARVRRPNE